MSPRQTWFCRLNGANLYRQLVDTAVRRMLVALRREEGVWRVRLEDFLTKPEDTLSGLRAPW